MPLHDLSSISPKKFGQVHRVASHRTYCDYNAIYVPPTYNVTISSVVAQWHIRVFLNRAVVGSIPGDDNIIFLFPYCVLT